MTDASLPRKRGRPRSTRLATCHPDRPYFAKDLCKACYRVSYRKAYQVPAPCHPHRKLFAKRKCKRCYAASYNLAKRLQKLNLRPDRLQRMLSAAHGVCPFCLRDGRQLTPWRWNAQGSVSALICWPCRKRIMMLWAAVKGVKGVVWLGRVSKFATQSLRLLMAEKEPEQESDTDMWITPPEQDSSVLE